MPLIPFARVMTFSYNAAVLSGASNASIADHAHSLLDRLVSNRSGPHQRHRPLIFVGHSMGGLVIKQALIDAEIKKREYSCIKASTYGLVFFATPHKGGNRAGGADLVANICSGLTGGSRNSLLKQLERNSILREISTEQFGPQIENYDILTYFETKLTKVVIGKVAFFPQITSMVRPSVSCPHGLS